MIRKGDIVTIKPEWQDEGDDRYTWVARTDERGNRLDISAVELSNMAIWPMHLTHVDMVEKTGKRLTEEGEITDAT